MPTTVLGVYFYGAKIEQVCVTAVVAPATDTTSGVSQFMYGSVPTASTTKAPAGTASVNVP